MTKDEAIALFERIYEAHSLRLHSCMLSLKYTQEPGVIGKRQWCIVVGNWNSNHWILYSEQDWRYHKIQHGILETVEDTDAYADAMRTQASDNSGHDV